MWIRKFYVSIIKYRTQATPQIRTVFAAEVWKKYLDKGAKFRVFLLKKETLSKIQAELKSKDPDLFVEAEKECEAALSVFFGEFRKTPEFQEYIDTVYVLPDYLQAQLDDKGGKKKSMFGGKK